MATPLDDSLITEAALDVLGVRKIDGGWMTGGFRTALIETWRLADLENQQRLSYGFPELGYVMDLFNAGRTEDLQFLAKGGTRATLNKRRGI